MKKYVRAIIISNVFDIVGSVIVGGIFGIIIVQLSGGNISILTTNTGVYLFIITLGEIVSIAAGYLAAKLAKDKYLLMGALSSILCFLEGVASIITDGFTFKAIIFLILTPLLGILGGYLYLITHKEKLPL
jgi:hypothetical protein